MRAAVGDRIVVPGPQVDAPVRDGEIVAVPHQDGSPPYSVRWSDSGHIGLFFPGPGVTVHHDDGRRTTHPADVRERSG